MSDSKLTMIPDVINWPDETVARRHCLERAAEILRAGGLVAFPTDTVYGLAAHPLHGDAIDRIFEVKQRPPEKRIALLISGPGDMAALAASVPDDAQQLADAAWPGALTIVLKSARAELGPTIALRWPDHPIPTGLATMLGLPIATTSANRSGSPSTLTASDVLTDLPCGYELLIDGGPAPGGTDSTVIDLSGPEPRLLRRGALSEETLAHALGRDRTRSLLCRDE